MACLRDIPTVIRQVGPLTFLRRVVKEIGDDHLMVWASSLAYSWLFAVFPFLIFLLSLVPYLPPDAKVAAEREIGQWMYSSLPREAADTLWNNVMQVLHRPRQGLLGVGIAVTIWAAAGGMAMTMSALDRCYEVEAARSFLKHRIIAVGLTIAAAILALSVLVLLPIGTIATRLATEWLQHQHRVISWPALWAWNISRFSLAILLLFLLVGLVYHFGIDVRQRFHIFTPGSVFTVLVWLALGIGFRQYVDRFGKYDQTYGTVGGVAVLLFVFYVDAVVLLVGAELNSEIDFAVLNVPRGERDLRTPALARQRARAQPQPQPAASVETPGGGP